MGTYTSNYNLFMPTVGEQGWGELVNGNFTTIDTTIKGLDTRVGTLETKTVAIEGRVTTSEERITTLEDTIISGEGDVTFASINPSYIYVPFNKTYGVPIINISKSYENTRAYGQNQSYTHANIFSFTVPSTSIFKPTNEIDVDVAMTATKGARTTFTLNITDSVGNNVFSKGGSINALYGTSVTGTISIVLGETYTASISSYAEYSSNSITVTANATSQYYI